MTDRCSAVSAALGEPLLGTASTVRDWLLLEWPGPWGPEALASTRLPAKVRGPLRERAEALGVRIVLIRRVGRPAPDPRRRRAYVVHTGPGAPWAERRDVAHPDELMELDLEALSAGTPPRFGPAHPDPVYLVCAHGRRDPCCAERGRPLAGALAATRPESVWESSHIGGDRFAGNLVCFPHGLYFGRVEPAEAAVIADAYERGEVAPSGYRGRSCYGFAVQVAEAELRRREGISGVDALRLAGVTRTGAVVESAFDLEDGRRATVRVRVGRSDARRLTCHAEREEAPRTFSVEPG